ncbi:MAG TPA: hypothetical protein VNE82_23540 [Candidatus Binataceae bacterium]|nr:hypothetical protein [Candidatus Binataceae bacterium]
MKSERCTRRRRTKAKRLTEAPKRAILWRDREKAEMVEGADWMA